MRPGHLAFLIGGVLLLAAVLLAVLPMSVEDRRQYVVVARAVGCGSVVSPEQHGRHPARSKCHDRRVSAAVLSGSAGLLAAVAIGVGWFLLRRRPAG